MESLNVLRRIPTKYLCYVQHIRVRLLLKLSNSDVFLTLDLDNHQRNRFALLENILVQIRSHFASISRGGTTIKSHQL